MLNFISKTQVDCPVAVVFGHASMINWAGKGYAAPVESLADAFWNTGFYADIIPASEIESDALTVDETGKVRYGNQTYSAVVLYNPEFEKPSTGAFFRKAAKGNTALYRLGDWTKGFDGKPFDGAKALPSQMTELPAANAAVAAVTDQLRTSGLKPSPPGPARSGQSRLIDGTVILVQGENDNAGDPIQQTIDVDGHKVTFDALGVAAVRLDKTGKLEALAAGGLKRFAVGSTVIELPQRADVALWKDENGQWQGILQDFAGEVPEQLTKFTSDWLRLEVPTPLP
jgi:hypothetical protein